MSAPLIPRKSEDNYGAIQQQQQQATKDGATAVPSSQASFTSRMLFGFVDPLMRVGNERQLSEEDMWELEGENRTAAAFARFNCRYQRTQRKSIGRTIWATYAWSFFLCGLGAAFTAACNLLSPAVLNYVINAFSAPQLDMESLTRYLGLYFASRLANAVVAAQSSFAVEMIALRVTVALKSLLFQKAMRRSIQSKTSDEKAVDIANLYTSDVDNILWAARQINNVWVLPLQISAVVYMLYSVIGAAAFAGFAVITASMLASFATVKISHKAYGDIMERKDDRMKVIKEVFGAIQIVKLNAWEAKFAGKIGKLRELELQVVARFMYTVAVEIFIMWSTPVFVSTVSFAVYSVGMGQTLTAAKVFTAIALFEAIRDPLTDLPNVIQQLVQAKISISRMAEFLALEEHNPVNVTRVDPAQPEDVVVAIESGSFGWSRDASPLLKNVNLTVKKGDFVVVHGAVGAGKSSLCSTILGEMEKISGSVFVRGTSVAYYSQQTWIQNMTIRDNIL
ncbi:Abc transporter c family member 5, partial [Globisporangium polare]